MFETKEGVIKPIVYVGLVRGDELLLVDYVDSPNPSKTGWWIPAPGLAFGEDPLEKATAVAKELGFASVTLKLKDVESFVHPGGWHLIHHFVGEVSGEPKAGSSVRAFRWVTASELEEMRDLAHGKWEAAVGRSYLAR